MAKLISIQTISPTDIDGIEAYVRRNYHRSCVALMLDRAYRSSNEGNIRAFISQLRAGQIDITKVTRAWP